MSTAKKQSRYYNMGSLKYILQLSSFIVTLGILLLCLLFISILNEPFRDPAPAKIHRVYTISMGRFGNHLHNLVGTYGLSRTNHRKLVLEPDFMGYIKRFLNVSYLNFEIAKAPEWVPLKWFRYATYEPEMEHLEEKDLKLGYYIQVIQYFLPYVDEIKKFLVINDNLVETSQDFLHSLHLSTRSTFIGIHVRRTDFVEIEETSGRLVPKARYLKKAMIYFLSRYQNVEFIVCSDDLDWCKLNETFLQPGKLSAIATYGIHFSPGTSPEHDLALLAQCNHTIITVGTFGWWGAWLAGGEVIYFNHPNKEGSSIDKDFTAEDYFWPTWIGMDDSP